MGHGGPMDTEDLWHGQGGGDRASRQHTAPPPPAAAARSCPVGAAPPRAATTRGRTRAPMIAPPHDPSPAVSARQAVEILNKAGAVLTGSLAYEETLRLVVELVVPDV